VKYKSGLKINCAIKIAKETRNCRTHTHRKKIETHQNFSHKITRSAMAPNLPSTTTTEYLPSAAAVGPALPEATKTDFKPKNEQYKVHLVWRNIIAFVYLHLGAIYGIYLCFTHARFYTFLWSKYTHRFFIRSVTCEFHPFSILTIFNTN